MLALAMMAIDGHVAIYGATTKHLLHLFVSNRSEITVITTDYGLNCSAFPVPNPYPKPVFPGYVTKVA